MGTLGRFIAGVVILFALLYLSASIIVIGEYKKTAKAGAESAFIDKAGKTVAAP
jgi:hypothetical protein